MAERNRTIRLRDAGHATFIVADAPLRLEATKQGASEVRLPIRLRRAVGIGTIPAGTSVDFFGGV